MIDELVRDIAAEGWRIWHLGNGTRGQWSCLLFTDCEHPAVQDMQNRTRGGYVGGFSRNGYGVSMAAAIRDAARDIILQKEEEWVDLNELLG